MKTSTILIAGAALVAAVYLWRRNQPAQKATPVKKKPSTFSRILGGVRKVSGMIPGLPKFDYAPAIRGQLGTSTILRGRVIAKPKSGGSMQTLP